MPVLDDDMKKLVEYQRLGFVATVCPDNTPNVSPKGTLCVLDDDHLVFADIRSPGTVTNLRSNAAVEVNVVDPLSRKGYRFKGTGVVYEAGVELERLVAFFARRGLFDASGRIRAVVVIRVHTAKPMISPGYDQGATEEEVRAQWRSYYFGDDESAV